jgi:phosphate-selective porin
VARYSHVDLSDGLVEGGVLARWGVGVNWWASAQWKLCISYGDADLDKYEVRGNTRMLLKRLQWMY